MTLPDSVAGDERLRLFLALRLPEPVLDVLAEWQGAHLSHDGVRVVPRAHLHLTLAFLGHRPADELGAIVGALRAAAAAADGTMRLAPARYRETGGRERAGVGMIVLDDLDGGAAALAADLHGRLEALGAYRAEARPWLPHATVARFRARPGLRPPLPAMGTFVPSDAAAYLSRLHPGGAQYAVLESVALGG
jgi:2'-5' RNA ligase